MASTIQPNDVGITNQPGNNTNNQTVNTNANNQPGTPQQQTNTGFKAYNPQQQGTGYTNIQSIVGANQNNQLGQTIGNNVTQAGQSVANNVNQAQQQFQTQSAADQVDTSANQQFAQNALANPTSVNPSQYSQFANLLSGQYSGPTGLTNATDLQNQASNIQQQNQALGTQQGRVGLLNQYVGGPQYTQGEQQLDALLLGQTGQPQLNAARQATNNTYNNTQNAIQGAANTAQANTAAAQQFGQNLQGQFANTVGGINSGLNAQAQQAQTAQTAAYNQALSDYQSGNMNAQEASLLGLTQGENVGNLLANPATFIQQNPNQATAQNVASGQQYAQLQALQQLAGGYAPTQAAQTLAQFNNPALANTFQNEAAYQNIQSGTPGQTAFQAAVNNENQNISSTLAPAQQANQQAQDIYNLASGQVPPAYSQLAQQIQAANPQAPQSWINQQIIDQVFPGAASNSGGVLGTNMGWAANNYTTNAAKLAAVQQQLQNQYGVNAPIQLTTPTSNS